jgi:two-component system, OmpR family, KDP operon response regulator KdpE
VSGPRILVVDDEPQIRRALRVGLAGHGYDVQLAGTGEEALDLAAVAPPDVIILDLMLPGLSGLDVCKGLREWSQAPIIVLSAKGEERDKVEALDLGADDYLTKPFGMDELLARIRAALRRTAGEAPTPVLEIGELRLDQARRLLTSRGREIHLTPTEYDMLRYLMTNAGKVITHRALLRAVWGPGYEDGSQTLRFFIAQLRRKIEPEPSRPIYIRTEPGVGYRFRADP